MKSFNKIFACVILTVILVFFTVNAYIILTNKNETGRPYRVEINRLSMRIQNSGWDTIDFSKCEYVTNIRQFNENDKFYEETDSDYMLKEIDGKFYRFDYSFSVPNDIEMILVANIILGVMTIIIIVVMVYIRFKILKPFENLREVPYELSRGNLAVPIKEYKNRFFGRFVWGVDLLRENIEQQKRRELELQRDKKILIMSISHDIKTPLSAIKLYSKALSKGLYRDVEKQAEIADSINLKADEIENFVSQIIKASGEDFLHFEVENSEFYLSEMVNEIKGYYTEKLSLLNINFTVEKYSNCLLKGDLKRGIEVIQNLMENAVKYGDGYNIAITFSDEEECCLVTVSNSGCMLSENELPHIFDSFWRGSNTGTNNGNGLGLYICRQLMNKMDGDIFVNLSGDEIKATVVFQRA